MKKQFWSGLAGALLVTTLGTTSASYAQPSHTIALTHSQADGIASWYGPGSDGSESASGETFNQNALTAAHRNLPFGTRVKVTNMNNGRSVVVRINDRGPFVRGRIIDLSTAAARGIGMMETGVAPVHLEILDLHQAVTIDEN